MKHAKLKIALTAAAAATFTLALVGCSGGSGKADYDHVVTFDYNVGYLLGEPETEAEKEKLANQYPNQYLGVKDGTPIVLKPGEKDGFKLAVVEGYEFNGWYLPQSYDANGEPVRGEDGCVILGREWNFRAKVTEDITLYASFVIKVQLTVEGIAVAEDGTTSAVELDSRVQKNLEALLRGPVGSGFTRPTGSSYIPKATGYTFVEYYKDEALTEIFDWENYTIEGDDTVYAKFRVGNWAFDVATAKDFNSAISTNQSITLADDINFEGVEWIENRNYSGIIEGNNHTVSNIICVWDGSSFNSEFALFGTLGETFKIKDVTFENISLSFTAKWPPNSGSFTVSAFANSIHESAVFENFSFSATFNVARGGSDNVKDVKIDPYEISPDAPSALEPYFNVTKNYNI